MFLIDLLLILKFQTSLVGKKGVSDVQSGMGMSQECCGQQSKVLCELTGQFLSLKMVI